MTHGATPTDFGMRSSNEVTRPFRTATARIFWLLLAASCAAPAPHTTAPLAARTAPESPDPDAAARAAERTAERATRRSPLVLELEKCLPAAVDIIRLNPDHVNAITGSGSLIHETGYILSVNHVPMDGAVITPCNGKRYRSRVIASVPGSDLAIGKIDADAPLPWLPLGRSETLKSGDPLIAIGGPGERLVFTVSTGPLAWRFGTLLMLPDMVSFGNSGGPLIDSAGRQVGVVRAMDASGASGAALDINAVRQIISQVLSEPECGVRLGLTVNPMGEPKVTRIRPGSPAERAGLLPGDILTRVASFRISDGVHYYLQLSERKPGEHVTIEFSRDGKPQTAELTVEAQAWLGATYESVNGKPVFVRNMTAGSPAEKAGLKPGDVIVAVDGKQPQAPIDVVNATLAKRPGDELALDILRGGQPQRITMTVGKRPCKAETLPPAQAISELAFLGIEMPPSVSKTGQTAPQAVPVPVSLVLPGSPAEKAGLKVGDIITAVDGTQVQRRGDVNAVIQSKSIGDTMTIEILRGNQKQVVKVTLSRQP